MDGEKQFFQSKKAKANPKNNPSVKHTDIKPGIVIKSAELETVCGITSTFPEHEEAEFAFAGKSNVGKSSLINVLMQRRSLARTSATPGKTQTVNYYNVNKEFYLVDLPGYGFTKASPETREKWGKMVERYLAKSKTIRYIFLLVDMRHKPTEDDCLMYDWVVSKGYRPIIVATKYDKLNKNEIPKAEKLIKETLGMDSESVFIAFSSVTKEGRERIYDIIRESV